VSDVISTTVVNTAGTVAAAEKSIITIDSNIYVTSGGNINVVNATGVSIVTVAVDAGDTATTIATKVADQLNGASDLGGTAANEIVTASGNVLTITSGAVGISTVGWDLELTTAKASTKETVVSETTVTQTVEAIAGTATSAQWSVNAVDASTSADLNALTAGTNSLLFGSKLTVTYSGASTTGASGVTNGAAVALTKGFESTVTVDTTANLGNMANINQAIKAAIIGDSVEGGASAGNVLEELVKVTDGPANSLVVESLIDGTFSETDLAITLTAATFTSLSTADQAALRVSLQTLNKASGTTYTDAQMQTALDDAVTAANNALKVDILTAGTASTSVSDNTINLGSGDDVLVLGTDATSNDTIVFTGTDIGNNTIVNFTTTGTAQDKLDFSSYLTNQTDTSVNTNNISAVTIAKTGDNSGVAASTITANQIATINDFVQTSATVDTWAGLTSVNFLSAIQNETGTAVTYANLVNSSLDVVNTANLVGTVQHSIVMVENDLNQGEYKVFDLTSSTTTTEFTAAALIGTVDFGASIDASTASLFV
jgi:hypothetical protein